MKVIVGIPPRETDHNNMIDFLETLNVKYNLGNDAPRGGLEGDFIEVNKAELKKAFIKCLDLCRPYPRKKGEFKRQLSIAFQKQGV